ncbi:hypothetical protein QBC39DRAFT_380478 [Podospora conica]|nr:hypothetical protein QBC39DRAFT_380478 [Schizothecium conicum]
MPRKFPVDGQAPDGMVKTGYDAATGIYTFECEQTHNLWLPIRHVAPSSRPAAVVLSAPAGAAFSASAGAAFSTPADDTLSRPRGVGLQDALSSRPGVVPSAPAAPAFSGRFGPEDPLSPASTAGALSAPPANTLPAPATNTLPATSADPLPHPTTGIPLRDPTLPHTSGRATLITGNPPTRATALAGPLPAPTRAANPSRPAAPARAIPRGSDPSPSGSGGRPLPYLPGTTTVVYYPVVVGGSPPDLNRPLPPLPTTGRPLLGSRADTAPTAAWTNPPGVVVPVPRRSFSQRVKRLVERFL